MLPTFAPGRSSIRLLGAVVLIVVANQLLPAQESQQYGLTGEIQVSRGSFPPRRIEVLLETRGTRAGATYADNEGKFSFSVPYPNVYYVVINDPDFEPVRQAYEIRELSGFSNIVHITLVPKEHERNAGPASPISGGNPYMVNTREFAKHYLKGAVKEFDKGNKAAQQGASDDAIRHFNKAVALVPAFYEARNNLGLIYLGKMEFAKAEEQFREVLRIEPSDDEAYFNLGNAYLLSKQFPEARLAIETGLEKRPDSAFGKFLLGTVCSRMGDRALAERLFRESLQMNSNMIKARLELVNLYLQENRKVDAINELKEFLKTDSTGPLAVKVQQVLTRLEAQTSTP